jgi:hypothetical protein
VSRATNFDLPEQRVRDLCTKRGISISAIEPLPSGGTHLVCTTMEGADEVRLKFGKHIIKGAVRRFPFFRA